MRAFKLAKFVKHHHNTHYSLGSPRAKNYGNCDQEIELARLLEIAAYNSIIFERSLQKILNFFAHMWSGTMLHKYGATQKMTWLEYWNDVTGQQTFVRLALTDQITGPAGVIVSKKQGPITNSAVNLHYIVTFGE